MTDILRHYPDRMRRRPWKSQQFLRAMSSNRRALRTQKPKPVVQAWVLVARKRLRVQSYSLLLSMEMLPFEVCSLSETDGSSPTLPRQVRLRPLTLCGFEAKSLVILPWDVSASTLNCVLAGKRRLILPLDVCIVWEPSARVPSKR